MFSQSVSVPQAIKEILFSNNLYLQALLAGIANYTALAQKIKPDVEKITASEVNIGTIVVAIKRLVDNLQSKRDADKITASNDYPIAVIFSPVFALLSLLCLLELINISSVDKHFRCNSPSLQSPSCSTRI